MTIRHLSPFLLLASLAVLALSRDRSLARSAISAVDASGGTVALVAALLVVVCNLVVDLAYGLLDPRARLT